MRVLVVNAGSSSLELRLLGDGDSPIAARDLGPPDGRRGTAAEIRGALAAMGAPDAVGHRIVHGGTRYRQAVRIDEEVLGELRALTELAPLHQPKSLAALDAVSRALPETPAVACFDTAFHASMPDAAATYALPASLREGRHIRRYGFHGLSHSYASRRAAELLGRAASELRIVTCHLGAGASLAAVRDGRSVDTTMGFTPLEGLVMATRSGSVDPGLLLWLLERGSATPHALATTLERRSGLLGLAGTGDMREVLARAASGDHDARLAREVYLHSLRAGVAAMSASLGGLDALAFTGGVGENSPEIRRLAADGLGFLGVAVDPAANEDRTGDRDISAGGAPARTLVIAAREDLEIARQTRGALGA